MNILGPLPQRALALGALFVVDRAAGGIRPATEADLYQLTVRATLGKHMWSFLGAGASR